ncbi:MAG: hypothetical protein Q8921_11345 [Bacteroidota bacterium]|nr:hypothetical protein [Bacteroidota bacterium]MDP4243318.1 hypothetical protein [Bacteroidota bacterium]
MCRLTCLSTARDCVFIGMMAMEYSGHLYSDAVHYAMTNAISRGDTLPTRIDSLWELLYGLGPSIPKAWNTLSRSSLERGERSIDRVVFELSNDVAYSIDTVRYHVLSSVLLVALTIKQMMPGIRADC